MTQEEEPQSQNIAYQWNQEEDPQSQNIAF